MPCVGACSEWFSDSLVHVPNFVDIGVFFDSGPDLNLAGSAYKKNPSASMTELLLQESESDSQTNTRPNPWRWEDGPEQVCTTHPLSSIYGTHHSEYTLTDPNAPTSTDACPTHTARICLMSDQERADWCKLSRDRQVHCDVTDLRLKSTLAEAEETYGGSDLAGENEKWVYQEENR